MMFLFKFGAFVSQTKIIVLLSFKGHRQDTEIMLTEAKEANATGAPLKKKKSILSLFSLGLSSQMLVLQWTVPTPNGGSQCLR